MKALERTIVLPHRVDLEGTLRGIRRGRNDPSCQVAADGVWRATRTVDGPVTVHLHPDGDRVQVSAWGDGAEAALDGAPDLIGAHDQDDDFHPDHPLVAKLHHDHPGVRVPRSRAVVEALVANVLTQRVTSFEARRSHRQLVTRWGEPAPGPGGLWLPPHPDVLAGIPHYDLHVIGVERKRADTVRRVGANARRLDQLTALALPHARERLLAIPGVGPWTAANVALVALGDPDAVPIGDVHLPRDLTYALTGTAVDDDEAMLDALAPFVGHRGRVIRLVEAAGIHAPRRAPRYAPRDITAS